jgi:hypothetical protein
VKTRRRRPFVDLHAAEIEIRHDGSRFLRFDREGLRHELEQAGVLAGLRARGYGELELRIEYEAGEHRLRIEPAGSGVSLVDLRLGEAATVAEEPLLQARGLSVLSFLSIHWLSLQDPRGRFTPDRPQLPGQIHPGLGLSRPLVERVRSWALAWGKDGLLNVPEYFHNAAFYSPEFRFLSPGRQGRFEALSRDLARLHIARASAAVEAGEVVEEPPGAPLRWQPGEMVAPLSEPLRACLASDAYAAAVAAARKSVRYRLASPGSSARPPEVPSE